MAVDDLRRARRVYLAGPEVFLDVAAQVLAQKKAICAAAGLVGVSPFDNEAARGPDSPEQRARRIYRSNRIAMDSCAFAIANVTPFRGVSIDPGTAFEVGYMCARASTVFGYSADGTIYADRVAREAPTNRTIADTTGTGWDVERFGQIENLMIPFGIEESGGAIFSAEAAVRQTADVFADLTLFSRCVDAVAACVAQPASADPAIATA